MTFLAREKAMWGMLADCRVDPFAQLASMWLGTPLSQARFLWHARKQGSPLLKNL